MTLPDDPLPPSSHILYQTEDGRTRIQCRFEDETIWLTQAQIAELFQATPQNVTLHLKAILSEGELGEAATCKDYLQVRLEGTREVAREVEHYSLPVILADGYRLRSARGTQFRQWATALLSQYLVKGFAIDDERLKHPPGECHADYFDELLERIRDIRASERRVYLRVREILALAADYAPRRPGYAGLLSVGAEQAALCCSGHDRAGAHRRAGGRSQTKHGADGVERRRCPPDLPYHLADSA